MAIDIRIIKLENYDWQGSRMARKIYIIGNGFDLYFGLKKSGKRLHRMFG